MAFLLTSNHAEGLMELGIKLDLQIVNRRKFVSPVDGWLVQRTPKR